MRLSPLLALLLLGASAIPADGVRVAVTSLGNPLPGAAVTISRGGVSLEVGETDSGGTLFAGPLAAGEWVVSAALGNLAATGAITLFPGREGVLRLSLDPPASLAVAVAGPDGPLAGATVVLEHPTHGAAATTDAAGYALFPSLPPGTALVRASHPEHGSQARRLTLAAGEQAEVSLTLASLGLSAELDTRLAEIQATGLQVMVVLDSTSSMDHLIVGARQAILDLAAALDTLVPGAQMGLGAYRARGSDYILHPQNRNLRPLADPAGLADLVEFLGVVEAGQGGSEAVMTALEWALEPERGWLEGTEKVVVLLGDAKQRTMTAFTMAGRFTAAAEPLGGATLHAMGTVAAYTRERDEDASEEQFRGLTRRLDGAYRRLPRDAGNVEGTLHLLRAMVAFSIGAEFAAELDTLLTPEGLAQMRANHGW